MKVFQIFLLLIGICNEIEAQWEPLNGPFGGFINDMGKNETSQFAATPNGLYRSQDEGLSWNHLTLAEGQSFACLDVGIYGNTIITDAVSMAGGKVDRYLFRSVDNGEIWEQINRPNVETYLSIVLNTASIYLTDTYDLWVSSDNGVSWNLSSVNPLINRIYSLDSYGEKIYVNSFDTLYYSPGNSDDFIIYPLNATIDGFFEINPFADFILANSSGKLYKSINDGETWAIQSTNYRGGGTTVIIGDSYYSNGIETIFKSVDQGVTWVDQHSINFSTLTHILLGAGETLFTGSQYTGIMSSNDGGISFNPANFGISACFVETVASQNENLLTGSIYIGISRFDKQNSIWDTTTRLEDIYVIDIASIGKNVMAANGFNIFLSKNDGLDWQDITPTKELNNRNRFFAYKDSILAGGYIGSYLIISDEEGLEWLQYTINVPGHQDLFVYLFAHDENILMAANHKVLFRSLDDGVSWDTAMNGLVLESERTYLVDLIMYNDIYLALEVNETNLVHQLNISFDNGENWQPSDNGIPIRESYGGIKAITRINDIFIASMYNSLDGVYVSYDNAHSWHPFNEGLDLRSVNEIAFDDEYLYAATRGQGVWRRKIDDLYTVGTQLIPSNQELFIFPNPTNGNINLRIDSFQTGKAKLLIHDISGSMLESKDIYLQNPLEINITHLPPGLYILTLQTEGHVYSGKFIVQD